MMDSPFEAAFRATADGKPLGMKLLVCLLVPPAVVLAAIAPDDAHGKPTRPAEGFGAVLPPAPAPRPAFYPSSSGIVTSE